MAYPRCLLVCDFIRAVLGIITAFLMICPGVEQEIYQQLICVLCVVALPEIVIKIVSTSSTLEDETSRNHVAMGLVFLLWGSCLLSFFYLLYTLFVSIERITVDDIAPDEEEGFSFTSEKMFLCLSCILCGIVVARFVHHLRDFVDEQENALSAKREVRFSQRSETKSERAT